MLPMAVLVWTLATRCQSPSSRSPSTFLLTSKGGGRSARAANRSEELDMDNLIATTQRARDQVTSYFPSADDKVVTIGVVLVVLQRVRQVT